jgi:hypothetical protein
MIPDENGLLATRKQREMNDMDKMQRVPSRTKLRDATPQRMHSKCARFRTWSQPSPSLCFYSPIPPFPPRPCLIETMVLLVTSDNEQFHADTEVLARSVLIKNMLEGNSDKYP